MIQVLHIILVLLFAYWVFRILFTPSLTWSLGIVGSIVIGAAVTLGGFESGVSLVWLAMIVLSAIVLALRYRTAFFEGTWDEWLMLALGLVVLASYHYTPSREYGRYKMLLFLGSGVPLFFFSRMVGRNLTSAYEAFSSAVAPSFLILMVFALSLYMGVGMKSESSRFGTGMSIMYGVWIAMCVGMLLHSFYRPGMFYRVLSLIGIGAGLATIPFTGSRTAFVGLFLAVLLTYASFKNAIKTIAVVAVVVVFATVALRLLTPEETQTRLENVSLGAMEESGRLNMYAVGLKGFLHRPIRGVGVGGYSTLLERPKWDKKIRVYPHNLWVEIASEQGLLGLIPLMGLTILGFRRLIWLRKHGDRAIAIPFQVIFWLAFFQSMATADLPMSRGIFAVFGFLAGYHRCCLMKRGTQPSDLDMLYYQAEDPDVALTD